MAISTSASILAMLKVYYKDGVENLMFRDSPVLGKLKKERVEGKTVNFSAIAGAGGAVAGDYLIAAAGASSDVGAVEYAVEPGQLWSTYSVNVAEVQASASKRGAYMKTAGASMFNSTKNFRKAFAAAFYGKGFGEIALYDGTALTSGTAVDITLPAYATMAILPGTKLEVKTTLASANKKVTLTVNKIKSSTSINVTPDTTVTPLTTDYVCLKGSVDAAGHALLPIGMGGWLPTDRQSLSTFFGVDRSVNPDAMAGVFYDATSNANEKKSVSVQKLLQQVRRQGSKADLIIMNDEDCLEFSREIEATNTYFTATSTKAKKEASVGFNSFSASFSTNYIDNIIDDPFCPKGRFYVLDSDVIELDSWTSAKPTEGSVAGNEPGKDNPMEYDGDGKTETPNGLVIDDYLNVQPGTDTVHGPALRVSLMFIGAFIVRDASVCGVGKFYGASGIA